MATDIKALLVVEAVALLTGILFVDTGVGHIATATFVAYPMGWFVWRVGRGMRRMMRGAR